MGSCCEYGESRRRRWPIDGANARVRRSCECVSHMWREIACVIEREHVSASACVCACVCVCVSECT